MGEINDLFNSIEEAINFLQWLFIWGTITFFVSNLIIIIEIPKIRRLLEKICYEKEEEEEEKENI